MTFLTLMLYKNNNTGKNIGTEVIDLADLGGYRAENGLLNMISLIGSNIAGTSQYERVRVSSTVQFYTLTLLRPREVLLKVCWDLQIKLPSSFWVAAVSVLTVRQATRRSRRHLL